MPLTEVICKRNSVLQRMDAHTSQMSSIVPTVPGAIFVVAHSKYGIKTVPKSTGFAKDANLRRTLSIKDYHYQTKKLG